jgi:hypothetical protein
MTSRRTGLLSLVAVLALALVPASAAAEPAEWTHEGAALEEHAEISLEGSQVFVTAAGPMICDVDATLTAEPGSSGAVTDFTTGECMGFGGMAGCTVTSTEPEAASWPVHVNTTDLTATEVTQVRNFNAGCPVKRIESTIPEMTTLLPEPHGAISEIEYFGNGEASIDGGAPGEYEEIGSWLVTPAGTYGIG